MASAVRLTTAAAALLLLLLLSFQLQGECSSDDDHSCPEGTKKQQRSRRFCQCHRRAPAGGKDLVIVADTSTSMQSEVSALMAQLPHLVEGGGVFDNAYLVTYDASGRVGKAQKLESAKQAGLLLERAAQGAGTGDVCRRPALEAAAVGSGSGCTAGRHCVVLLLTDAPSVHFKATASVAASGKLITYVTMATIDRCRKKYDGEYHYLARANGGAVASVTEEQLPRMLEYFGRAAVGQVNLRPFPKSPAEVWTAMKRQCDCGKQVQYRCLSFTSEGMQVVFQGEYSEMYKHEYESSGSSHSSSSHSSSSHSSSSHSSSSSSISSSSSSSSSSSHSTFGSLIFVLDATENMNTYLQLISEQIQSLWAGNRAFGNVVLAAYVGGGRHRVLVKTASAKKLSNALAKLRASVGSDSGAGGCQQSAFAAIEDAAVAADANSLLFHFTASSPSDAEMWNSVSELCRSRSVSAMTLVAGSLCGGGGGAEYRRLAKATRGSLLTVDIESFGVIFEYITTIVTMEIEHSDEITTLIEEFEHGLQEVSKNPSMLSQWEHKMQSYITNHYVVVHERSQTKEHSMRSLRSNEKRIRRRQTHHAGKQSRSRQIKRRSRRGSKHGMKRRKGKKVYRKRTTTRVVTKRSRHRGKKRRSRKIKRGRRHGGKRRRRRGSKRRMKRRKGKKVYRKRTTTRVVTKRSRHRGKKRRSRKIKRGRRRGSKRRMKRRKGKKVYRRITKSSGARKDISRSDYYGSHAVVMSNTAFFARKSFGSLIFVSEVVESMSMELFALQRVVEDIERVSSSRFSNLVVGFYGGPYRRRLSKSRPGSTVASFVRSTAMVARDTGRQPAMAALADAVIKADSYSILIHMTDSVPSDIMRAGFVSCLSRYKNIRIFTVITGDPKGSASLAVYKRLAEDTRGAVLRLQREHISQFFEYIIRAETDVKLFAEFASFAPKAKPKQSCTQLTCRCGSRESVHVTRTATASASYGRGRASLGIVLDSTGSMTKEYAQIRDHVSELINSNSGLFDKFVLAEYNEPYTRRLVATNKSEEALDFLDDTFVFGGGDCPEPAFQAIRDVAKAVSPGSAIFLFTDASAKDKKLEKEVTQLLVRKDVTLNVVSTGDMCRSDGEAGEELQRTAAASGGRQLSLRKGLVKKVMEYIRNVNSYGLDLIRKIPKSTSKLTSLAKGCQCKQTTGC